jgi:hypothetical protein
MPYVLMPCSETELLGKEYLHSVGDDLFAWLMMHNTRLRKGCLYTGDLLSGIHPGQIISPYATFTSEIRKEDAWEACVIWNFQAYRAVVKLCSSLRMRLTFRKRRANGGVDSLDVP